MYAGSRGRSAAAVCALQKRRDGGSAAPVGGDHDELEMASTQGVCPRCDASCQMTHVQRAVRDELRWSIAITCSGCGYAQEADGFGHDPVVHAVLVAANGEWVLSIDDLGSSPLGALRILRDRLGLTPAETRRSTTSVATGSRSEIALLAGLLRARGAQVKVRRK
jgi:hypothetical protein